MFSLFVCLFTLYGQTNSEKMAHFSTLPRVEVINEQIYQLLDSLILYNKDCIFTILDKPHFFEMASYKREGDSVIIYVGSWQYFTFYLTSNDDFTGYFYYKDNLVMICKTFDIFSLFFKNTSDTQEFYYKRYDSRKDFAYYDGLKLTYYYINNAFIAKFKSLCMDASPYLHIVRRKETWKSIANRFGITVKELKALNKTEGNKLPKLQAGVQLKITPPANNARNSK